MLARPWQKALIGLALATILATVFLVAARGGRASLAPVVSCTLGDLWWPVRVIYSSGTGSRRHNSLPRTVPAQQPAQSAAALHCANCFDRIGSRDGRFQIERSVRSFLRCSEQTIQLEPARGVRDRLSGSNPDTLCACCRSDARCASSRAAPGSESCRNASRTRHLTASFDSLTASAESDSGALDSELICESPKGHPVRPR